jgi:acyl-CoA thioesterase FadM
MEECGGSWWILAVIATFDVYWILRLATQKLVSKIRSKIRHDEDSVNYSLCWTTDIDYFLHMNNGKYFREMDFGRFDWYFRTGLSDYLEAKPGVHFVQHGASIRYRRSIDFLVPFKLVTKLIYWDDRSLYFEQRFISIHDGFIRAVALCKNTCVGAKIQDMADVIHLPSTPPSLPEELKLWIQCQEVSSTRLRMAGYGRSVGTGLSSIDSVNTSAGFENLNSQEDSCNKPEDISTSTKSCAVASAAPLPGADGSNSDSNESTQNGC